MRNRLKYYRNLPDRTKIRQEDIAKLIGMVPAQVSQMENGHYIPSLKVALLVSQAFTRLLGMEVTVNDLWQIDKWDFK